MPRRLLLFAGPNGSGKSTVTTPATLERFGVPSNRYINADEIARELLLQYPERGQEERERLAFRLARERRQTYREHGESFAFETVFSHPSTLLDMKRCREAGFEIVLFFVTTRNPQINIERVSRRYLSGGHDVPVDRIRARYERVMHLMPRIVEDADVAFVHDNSDRLEEPFPFLSGRPVLPSRLTSRFWQETLFEPLQARQEERSRLGGVSLPDEEKGEYTGELAEPGMHYLVQESVSELRLRHDRLLLRGTVENRESCIIRYHEGEGVILNNRENDGEPL